MNKKTMKRTFRTELNLSSAMPLFLAKYRFAKSVSSERQLSRVWFTHQYRQNTTSAKQNANTNVMSSVYAQQMYKAWCNDPTSVHSSWDKYFRSAHQGCVNVPPVVPSTSSSTATYLPSKTGTFKSHLKVNATKEINDHLKVQNLIRRYQKSLILKAGEPYHLHVWFMFGIPFIMAKEHVKSLALILKVIGHTLAALDPLGVSHPHLDSKFFSKPDMKSYGFTEQDLDRQFILPMDTFIGGKEKTLKLREIISRLEKTYCGHTGVEYMHLTNYEALEWIRRRFESPLSITLDRQQKEIILKRLIQSTFFEEFLAKKWPGEKRFGLEGCEVLIPAVKQLMDRSAMFGVDSFVIGMPHRGRLNVLANVCHQPFPIIFSQFSSLKPTDEGTADVKYHLGLCVNRFNRASHSNVKIAVVANPSHLEAVDPVVLGKVRAELLYRRDGDAEHTLAILMHGDAAISGEGIVMETFNLNNLNAYTVKGCIHIVVNNQIGFTTDPRASRSSPYCTDIGRLLGCPIFHVNSDDPEAVVHVCNVAADWRRKFRKDVIIDLVCYRRFGHNELDEPMLTQPIMYQRIKQIQPVFRIYHDQLINEGTFDSHFIQEEVESYNELLEEGYAEAKRVKRLRNRDWLDSPWPEQSKFMKRDEPINIPSTGVTKRKIDIIMSKFASVPEEFNLHKGLEKIIKGRQKMHEEESYDWACGEALAFGSLLLDGTHVRLSGEDVERGTFSHRHHVLHDQKVDGRTYVALSSMSGEQAEYTVCNSSLSEYGILGFEFGYSMVDPNSLVVWEAQFGDFANNAQCIIDQIICSGESKWIRQSGLVLSLPHGHEGMGPEHSSARVERFLQMCNEGDATFDSLQKGQFGNNFAAEQLAATNWIVTNCTTPANLFHAYRRQVLMPFRKPLVQFAPKSLLRHPLVRSPLADFLPTTSFKRMIADDSAASQAPHNVNRLIFCSGKIYYDLTAVRKYLKMESSIAINRIEQLSPFPYDLVVKELHRYKNAQVIWTQEEHKNAGAWTFVRPKLNTLLESSDRKVTYVGRPPSAVPATGNKFTHISEQRDVLAKSMGVKQNEIANFK
ncbi:unnamed protein product [Anisakis simplex]|uniref:2-oxoglutarate dehydrogenase, mitochondrial n=1 Tax=Anisakis simplex TaxID=6269 RepID=A0A0M3K0S1_ANISI|nr:unnamed protein product [Anisakis simplex]